MITLTMLKAQGVQPPLIVTATSQDQKLSHNKSCGATWLPKATCPGSCPHHPDNNGTCYALLRRCGMNWNRISSSTITDPEIAAAMECEAVATLDSDNPIRAHVSGDFIHEKHVRDFSAAATLYKKNALVKHAKNQARREKSALAQGLPIPKPKPLPFVWSYTHNMTIPAEAVGEDLSLFRSRETLDQVKKDHAEGWASVLVVSEFEKNEDGTVKKSYPVGDGYRIVPCREMTEGVKCVDCGLCGHAKKLHEKKLIVAFEAHGDHAARMADYVQF